MSLDEKRRPCWLYFMLVPIATALILAHSAAAFVKAFSTAHTLSVLSVSIFCANHGAHDTSLEAAHLAAQHPAHALALATTDARPDSMARHDVAAFSQLGVGERVQPPRGSLRRRRCSWPSLLHHD